MTKRLVKLRGTEDFRRVENRARDEDNPAGVTVGGTLWIACNPSPFEQAIKGVRLITFTVMNRMTIPFSKTSPNLLVKGNFDKPITVNGGAWQPVKAFNPASYFKPSLPCPKKEWQFSEQTFEQVQEQYWKNNIAQSGGNNAEPMESE